jgi:hypothetical protein
MAELAIATGRLHERLSFVHRQTVPDSISEVERRRPSDWAAVRRFTVEVALAEVSLAADYARDEDQKRASKSAATKHLSGQIASDAPRSQARRRR